MQSQPDRAWEKLACFLATGAGIGLIPTAPGTFGSLWGLVIAWGMHVANWPAAGQMAALAALWVVGIPICKRAAKSFGVKDPGQIVYDEFSSLPLVFVAVPFSLTTALIGFVLFRMFDTVKPWPVRQLETLPDGLGIIADDVAAAAYTTAVMWGIVRLSGGI